MPISRCGDLFGASWNENIKWCNKGDNVEAHLIQSTPEWLSLRRSKITSTDAGIILGVSPYCTPNLLWCRKLGLKPEQEVNQSMEIGSRLEPEAREAFIKETGIYVEPKVIIKDFQMASMDGVSSCGKYAVEIKCSKKIFEKALNQEVDDIYIAQIMHQMSVLDIPMIYFFAYWEGQSCIIECKRDDEYIKNLMRKEYEFFNLLSSFTAPEMNLKDYQKIDSIAFSQKIKDYHYANETAKHWKDLADKERDMLIEMCDGQSSIGAGMKLTKYNERGRINQKKLQEDHKEIDFDSYRGKTIEKWRIGEMKDDY